MPQTQRLLMVLALNLGLVAALVVVGVTAHSLAVLAEGGDYLLDAAGVSVALLAIWLSARPAGGVRRDGAPSASNVAALINSGWLLVLEILVAAAAVDRLASGVPQVQGLPVLIVSGIAAFVMTGGALILRGEDEDDANEHDLSMAAVLLDTIADAAAAAGVAVTGAVILAIGGWYWLDPAVALAIALVVAYHAVALIRKVLIRLRPMAANGSGDLSGIDRESRPMRLGGRSPDPARHAWRVISWRRVMSDYRRSAVYQYLGTSRSVCASLEALSLCLSLAQGAIVDYQNNDHGAGFCDPHLDDLASQAQAAQLTDPIAFRRHSSSAGLARMMRSSCAQANMRLMTEASVLLAPPQRDRAILQVRAYA
jgi:cobalt-zinc-cadmium efflux system protein